MPTYNRALDLMGLALIEQAKGNVVNAATLVALAAKSKSAPHALRMIEATNTQAIEAAAKARVEAAQDALPVVSASGSFEPTDESTMKLLMQGTAQAKTEVSASTVPTSDVVEVDAKTLKIAVALARVLAEVDAEAK